MLPVMNRFEYQADPFTELNRLHRRMNRLFQTAIDRSTEFPPVNVHGTEDEVVVSAELPGVDPDKLDVTVEGRVLTLSGERPAPAGDDKQVVYRQERSTGAFMRTVRLPFDVNNEQIAARYEHGILHITLPRSEATKPRRIQIAS